MRYNFVVSNSYEAWLYSSLNLFAIDPVIVHRLKKDGKHSRYSSIKIAVPRRQTKEDFYSDHFYVEKKYFRYLEILLARLEELHNYKFSKMFFRKAISLALLRHVSLCYDLFIQCEENFTIESHDCQILDMDAYQIPKDFDEHRYIFQNTNLGREQLFSIYCNLFYPEKFATWKPRHLSSDIQGRTENISDSRWHWRTLAPKKIFKAILRRVLKLRSPCLGVVESYFSAENFDRLLFGSLGKIQSISLPNIPELQTNPDWFAREKLTKHSADFDRFDKFVFTTLKYSFPKQILEDFSTTVEILRGYFDFYKHLYWVVSEAWIGHSLCSLSIAMLEQKSVRHIYNEHNYLGHPFVGNNLKYLAPIVEEFVSLGWVSNELPNFVRGASLFQWVEEKTKNKKNHHNILLILGLPLAYVPEINASYGDSGGFRALQYFENNKKFLERLGDITLSKTYVRSYPVAKTHNWLTWDQSYELSAYWSRAKCFDDSSNSGRVLMQQSRLIVVNYLSTSYLESLMSDIPTIFIWDKDTNLFLDEYLDIFDDLIKVGICQTNHEVAADFINSIVDEPEIWWARPEVQNARKDFLSNYIGHPSIMINYLLNKAKVSSIK